MTTPPTPPTPVPASLLPPGVVYSLAPPVGLSDQLARAVERAVAAIPPDRHGAVIGVLTERGTNLVLAGRAADGRLQAQAWIGKSGWDQPLRQGWELGAQITWVF